MNVLVQHSQNSDKSRRQGFPIDFLLHFEKLNQVFATVRVVANRKSERLIERLPEHHVDFIELADGTLIEMIDFRRKLQLHYFPERNAGLQKGGAVLQTGLQ